jgi:hypothetical protein
MFSSWEFGKTVARAGRPHVPPVIRRGHGTAEGVSGPPGATQTQRRSDEEPGKPGCHC